MKSTVDFSFLRLPRVLVLPYVLLAAISAHFFFAGATWIAAAMLLPFGLLHPSPLKWSLYRLLRTVTFFVQHLGIIRDFGRGALVSLDERLGQSLVLFGLTQLPGTLLLPKLM